MLIARLYFRVTVATPTTILTAWEVFLLFEKLTNGQISNLASEKTKRGKDEVRAIKP